MGSGARGGGGGGRQLVPGGGISYEWGGAAAPPEPMLDPGLVFMRAKADLLVRRGGASAPCAPPVGTGML